MSEKDIKPHQQLIHDQAADAIAGAQAAADTAALKKNALLASPFEPADLAQELRDIAAKETMAQHFGSSLASDRLAQQFATIGAVPTYAVEAAALAFPPYLDAMAAIQKSLDTPMAQAAAALAGFTDRMTSPALAAVRQIHEQMDRWKDMTRPSAFAIEAMGIGSWMATFSQSAAMTSIQQIMKDTEQLPALRAMKDYSAASMAMSSILSSSRVAEGFRHALHGVDPMSAYGLPSGNLDAIRAQLTALAESPLFRTLESTDLLALEALVESSSANLRSLSGAEERVVKAPDTTDVALQTEIINVLQGKGEQRALSPAALLLLWYLCCFVSTAGAAISQWNDVREGICDLNDRIPEIVTSANTKMQVRGLLCHMPASASARLRLVTRDNVNLREEPRMKSGVIMKLGQYAVLEVTDSSDRTWLQVIYKHDGAEVEGWVSRSMVRTVSK